MKPALLAMMLLATPACCPRCPNVNVTCTDKGRPAEPAPSLPESPNIMETGSRKGVQR